jgi:hypothetical protein
MIIICGTKGRYKTITTGQFYCPQCKTKRDYELRKARNYFALYFIPIIPLGDAGEFVTCLTCATNFQKDVLSIPIPTNTPLDRFVREAPADLDSGTLIEIAWQKVINIGVNRSWVEQVIEQAAGPDQIHRPADVLTCRSTELLFAQCGTQLV